MPEAACNDETRCPHHSTGRDLAPDCGCTTGNASQRHVRMKPIRRCVDDLPFVAQSGRTIFFVADEPQGWVVAELMFDAETCLYTLSRQSEYQWPREALGRLLSRVMVHGNLERSEADRVCDAFGEWLADRFAA